MAAAGRRPNSPERAQRCNQIWLDPILRDLARSYACVDIRYRCRFESAAASKATASRDRARPRNATSA